MTVETVPTPAVPSPADPGGWVAMFPVTAAWTAAWQEAGELWLGAVGEAGGAVADLAQAQTEFVSQAVTVGLETALHMVESAARTEPPQA